MSYRGPLVCRAQGTISGEWSLDVLALSSLSQMEGAVPQRQTQWQGPPGCPCGEQESRRGSELCPKGEGVGVGCLLVLDSRCS